jgi:hypothetical protein
VEGPAVCPFGSYHRLSLRQIRAAALYWLM